MDFITIGLDTLVMVIFSFVLRRLVQIHSLLQNIYTKSEVDHRIAKENEIVRHELSMIRDRLHSISEVRLRDH